MRYGSGKGAFLHTCPPDHAALLAARFAANDPAHPAVAAVRALCEARLSGPEGAACVGTEALRRCLDSVSGGPPEPLPEPTADPVDLLQHDIRLPSLPEVIAELHDTAASPSSSASDLAAVVAKDPGLAALLLRIVNSAFFGFPQHIETIPRAVAVVGVKQLTMLATGGAVAKLFGEPPDGSFRLEDFWRHSVGVAILARALCRRARLAEPERHFVAGLLHDVGRLALSAVAPDISLAATDASRRHHICLREAENLVAGFDHAAFGGMLLRKWNLPHPLVMAVLRHHEPEREDAREEAMTLHVADWLMKALHPARDDEYRLPPLSPAAWSALALPPGCLAEVMAELDDSLHATLDALLPAA